MQQNKLLFGTVMLFIALTSVEAQPLKQVSSEGSVDVRAEIGRTIDIVVLSGISSLVRSGDMASLKVEHVSGHLFITPLLKDPAELVVIDGVGRSYRLKFILDNGFDEKVVIVPPGSGNKEDMNPVSAVNFIRELVSGRTPAGAVESVRKEIVFEDHRVRMTTMLIYDTPALSGYVLEVENLLPQSLVVPVEQFNFPGLVAVSSQKDILSPGGSLDSTGLLYMVTSK